MTESPTPGVQDSSARGVSHWAMLATALGVVVATGMMLARMVLQVRLSEQGTAVPPSLLGFHRVFALLGTSLCLLWLAPNDAERGRARSAFSLLFILGAATIVDQSATAPGYGASLGVLGGIGLALWLLRAGVRSWRSAVASCAALCLALIWARVAGGRAEAVDAAMPVVAAAALLAPVVSGWPRVSRVAAIASMLYSTSTAALAVSTSPLLHAWLVHPQRYAGLLLAALCLRAAAQQSTAWSRWLTGATAILFFQAVALQLYATVNAQQLNLQQSLVPVAVLHFYALAIVTVLMLSLKRAGRTLAGWLGLLGTLIGAHLWCWAHVQLAFSGQARRVLFHGADALASIEQRGMQAAMVMSAGLFLVAIAQLFATPAQKP